MAAAFVHDKELVPISRYFPPYATWDQPDLVVRLAAFADQLPMHMVEKITSDPALIEQLLALVTGLDNPDVFDDKANFFMVGIKPFMDAQNYDADRIEGCCVHVVDPDGNPVSLCEYNALRRRV